MNPISSRSKMLAQKGKEIAQARDLLENLGQLEPSDESEPFQSSGSEYLPSDKEEEHFEEENLNDDVLNEIQNMNNIQPSTSTDVNMGRSKRGKKRKYPEQNREIRKSLYNTNKPYVSAKGKKVVSKIFDENFTCGCTRKCCVGVPVEQRAKLFSQFWTLGSFSARCALIKSCVKQMPKKRTYTKNESKRIFTRKYFINDKEVCKLALLKTLQITQNRVDIALKKSENMVIRDERGLKSGGKNKCTDEQVSNVIEHINSFPKYISHYCRNETNSRFLNPDLNLVKMYDLYKLLYTNSKPVSLAKYKSLFYSKFNLKFKTPKKDTCLTCDIFKTKLLSSSETEKETLKAAHNAHLNKAESLRNKMKEDLSESKTNLEVETLTFDMQKTHPIPKIPTGIAYYKRQLNFYNLGIHVGSQNQGIFNVWTENIAGRGTQEVGSSLTKYIKEHIHAPVKELRVWSDSCGGQNRSIKLVLLLLHALLNHPTLETITMRFLLSGHSFLPNDSEFGDVESALKIQERLYTDDDYVAVMANCRRKRKFFINRLQKNDFISVEFLNNAITNRKVDVEKNKVSWLGCHEIKLRKEQPTMLLMKSDFTEEPQTVNIEKCGKGRKPSLKDLQVPLLWPNGKSLSSEKLANLKELHKLVPKDAEEFYKFIFSSQTVDYEDDIDGFGASVDFEIETEIEDTGTVEEPPSDTQIRDNVHNN